MKTYHMCIGGLSVILLGIHIGLHICRKEMRTRIAVVMTILAVAGGLYGISSSGIVRWIGMPFRTATSSHLAVEREIPFGEQSGQGQNKGLGKGAGKGLGKGSGNSKGHGQGEMNLIQKINVFIQFFGLMFSFAMATYWVVIWKKKVAYGM